MKQTHTRWTGQVWMRAALCAAALLVLLSALLPAGAARAEAPAPVLDQSFVTPSNAAAEINGPTRYVAQTFTAGLTGALTAVSLDVESSSQFALRVQLHGVTGGLPNDTILSDVWVWGPGGVQPSAALSFMIDVGTVYVQAGQQYALVVQYDGSGSPGHSEGNWLGATGDPYAAGQALETNDETFTQWSAPGGDASLDLHFKTFVVPNVPVHDLSVTFNKGATRSPACKTFAEYLTVHNAGPDAAGNVLLHIGLTDHFDLVSIEATDGKPWPATMTAGESRKLKVLIKTTAYVPGETRDARFYAQASSDVWPSIELDPNPDNDAYFGSVWMVGKGRERCP